MYETKSKSLWRRMAALCAAAVLALTACVQCAYAQEKTVIPLGQAVGIKLFANGVLVVDVSALEGVGGKSPAQKCGIREGDLLLTFNGKKSHPRSICRSFCGKRYAAGTDRASAGAGE